MYYFKALMLFESTDAASGVGYLQVSVKGNDPSSFVVWLQLAKDLLHPSTDHERRQHKKKRLVQSPNSYFMDVKCPGASHRHRCVLAHLETQSH